MQLKRECAIHLGFLMFFVSLFPSESEYVRCHMQVLPLDQYVFNTEAHPLPIFGTPTERSHRKHYLKGDETPAFLHGQISQAALLAQIKSLQEAGKS